MWRIRDEWWRLLIWIGYTSIAQKETTIHSGHYRFRYAYGSTWTCFKVRHGRLQLVLIRGQRLIAKNAVLVNNKRSLDLLFIYQHYSIYSWKQTQTIQSNRFYQKQLTTWRFNTTFFFYWWSCVGWITSLLYICKVYCSAFGVPKQCKKREKARPPQV
jgi:hypothetical protein